VAPGLRNEDYVAFLDESGEEGLIVVAGVLIPARWLRAAERRWRDFVRDHAGSRSGRTEIKSRELLKGRGIAFHVQATMLANGYPPISAQGAGRQFYKDALEHIARTREVRVLAVGLDTPYASEVYRLWFWLAFAALIERPTFPRPRLPLVVIDGEDAAFREAHDLVAYRFYRAFAGRRYYIAHPKAWFIGGSVHQDSSRLPFVQSADLVAAAARHAIKKRKPVGSWYDTHLRQCALKGGREIDLSAHALKRLRRLDPKDKHGSGHFAAEVPP
jgi:hypothetical protein